MFNQDTRNHNFIRHPLTRESPKGVRSCDTADSPKFRSSVRRKTALFTVDSGGFGNQPLEIEPIFTPICQSEKKSWTEAIKIRFHLHREHIFFWIKQWITEKSFEAESVWKQKQKLPHQTIDVGDTTLRGKTCEAVWIYTCRFIWVRRHVIFEGWNSKQSMCTFFSPNMVDTPIYDNLWSFFIASEPWFFSINGFWILCFAIFSHVFFGSFLEDVRGTKSTLPRSISLPLCAVQHLTTSTILLCWIH